MTGATGNLAHAWPIAVTLLAGYLAGSIPFGLILTRLAGLGDIRKVGSGNIGATNVLRTGNKALAAATLLLDGGKGMVAALIAGRIGPELAVLAGAGAVVGHMFPVWLGFKGGKGVATGFGVLLGTAWQAGLAGIATWGAVALVTRYSSLAALVGFAASPLYAWLAAGLKEATLAAFIALLVFLRHSANIRRLIAGDEPRIGKKKH